MHHVVFLAPASGCVLERPVSFITPFAIRAKIQRHEDGRESLVCYCKFALQFVYPNGPRDSQIGELLNPPCMRSSPTSDSEMLVCPRAICCLWLCIRSFSWCSHFDHSRVNSPREGWVGVLAARALSKPMPRWRLPLDSESERTRCGRVLSFNS